VPLLLQNTRPSPVAFILIAFGVTVNTSFIGTLRSSPVFGIGCLDSAHTSAEVDILPLDQGLTLPMHLSFSSPQSGLDMQHWIG